MELNIVSWNVERDRSEKAFTTDLIDVYDRFRPHVVGIQEGMDYARILRQFKHMQFCLPKQAQGHKKNNPILIDKAFHLKDVKLDVVHPGVKGQFPPRNITSVKFTFQGRAFWHDNTHVNSHIDDKDWARLPRFGMSLDHIHTVAKKVKKHHRGKNIATWSGDFNIDWEKDKKKQRNGFPADVFQPAGLLPIWWELDEYLNTKGRRCIDAVGTHRDDPFVKALDVARLKVGGDHWAIRGKYNVKL